MDHQTEVIHISRGSEVAGLLDRVAVSPLRLEKDGVVYRLEREDTRWPGYDPESVRAAVRATAGSWADLDADSLIAHLYRARQEGSRPADRP